MPIINANSSTAMHSFHFLLCSISVSNCRKTFDETPHVMTYMCVVFFNKNLQLKIILIKSVYSNKRSGPGCSKAG